ncbi:hypothetical protein BCR36DRAFT_374987 [Piromyces finnis]|uniref:Uncharacterized protein n=1 Tax=Piromyces finnis TaxID=1754191 RepID=A0A1Y1UVZ0_9FUNG|nr:hypothetical protein BCR36DRAFT_374987 [Piromyces finnis]|eukprot:ORX41782.1 hypothetical protein BCR36DRAFT_374987 [Piromyces finnis]
MKIIYDVDDKDTVIMMNIHFLLDNINIIDGDVWATILYILTVVITIVISGVSIINRDTDNVLDGDGSGYNNNNSNYYGGNNFNSSSNFYKRSKSGTSAMIDSGITGFAFLALLYITLIQKICRKNDQGYFY